MTAARVLHLRASNFVGGPERQILRYARSERGAEVETVIASFVGEREGRDFLEEAHRQGVSTLQLPANGVGQAVSKLAEFLQENNIGLVCTHGYKATIVALLAVRKHDADVVPFLRGWTGEDAKVRIYEVVEKLALRFAKRIACLSNDQMERMSGAFKRKVRVVVNATQPQTVDRAHRLAARSQLYDRFHVPPDALIIASAGRLSPEKGTRYFVEAFGQLHSMFPNLHAIIFGDGTKREELQAQARDLGVKDRLRIAGHVQDFGALLPGIDLLVNPSLAEEMPNVVLEAMACGVPVLATAVGGVPEIAGQPEACLLVPPADPVALREAVSRLLNDPDARQELGRAGLDRITRAFSPARQQAQLLELYRESFPWVSIEKGPSADPKSVPFISVVMPVRNEERHIATVIGRLLEQEYPKDRYEILVADGNSIDRTREVVEALSKASPVRIAYLPNPGQLSSAGRNVGIRHAKGEIVMFVDGHCRIPGTHLLAHTARLMQQTGSDCLCRPQPLSFPGNTDFQKAVARVRGTMLGHGRDSTIFSLDIRGSVDPTSSGATYRKSVFERIGMYDESFDACEDVELNHRVKLAGLRAYIDPSLTIFYQPRASVLALFKQMSRYGRGRFNLVLKHPSAISLAQFVPAALTALLFLAWAVLFLPRFAGVLFIVPLAAYVLLVSFFACAVAVRSGWRGFIGSVAIYPIVHVGLGIGFWLGMWKALLGAARSLPMKTEIAISKQTSRGDK